MFCLPMSVCGRPHTYLRCEFDIFGCAHGPPCRFLDQHHSCTQACASQGLRDIPNALGGSASVSALDLFRVYLGEFRLLESPAGGCGDLLK